MFGYEHMHVAPGNGCHVCPRVVPADIAVAGNNLYAIYFIWGPELEKRAGDHRGEVTVFDSRNGETAGTILPGDEVNGTTRAGWVDLKGIASMAYQRQNGQHILMVEEDWYGKVLMYKSR